MQPKILFKYIFSERISVESKTEHKCHVFGCPKQRLELTILLAGPLLRMELLLAGGRLLDFLTVESIHGRACRVWGRATIVVFFRELKVRGTT